MQLVAYGAQDVYLTANPQVTFFKQLYRRHSNFAMESIEQTFNGTPGFGKKVSTTISRNGDLITDVFLEITLTKKDTATKTYWPAEALIKEVELEIGGQRIDRHTSTWLRVFSELFRKDADKDGYERLVNFTPEEQAAGSEVARRFYVPLVFFFNRNPGLALPLIALQYHEVKLNITFEGAAIMDDAGQQQAIASALQFATTHTATPVLVYSSAAPDAVRAIQQRFGVEQAGHRVEQTLAAIARGLVEQGVRQLVVAGGETSGACVQALGIEQMQIGPQIDPGVPWCHAASPLSPEGLHITLKSGNFGGVDFFTRSFDLLQHP